jgi:hypothetical protein
MFICLQAERLWCNDKRVLPRECNGLGSNNDKKLRSIIEKVSRDRVVPLLACWHLKFTPILRALMVVQTEGSRCSAVGGVK